MPRITVAIFPDNSRTFNENPYQSVPGANIVYYPEVPQELLDRILIAMPQEVNTILSGTADI